MSTTATKAVPTYLRKARLAAGYANRGIASMRVPYSPETIGRHERGEVTLLPNDALIYARNYGCKDILFRHCADCPVGREVGRQVTDRDLPFATLRLTQRLRKAAKEIADTLETIADDGIIDENERPVFDKALISLHELGETITDIIICAASQETDKNH